MFLDSLTYIQKGQEREKNYFKSAVIKKDECGSQNGKMRKMPRMTQYEQAAASYQNVVGLNISMQNAAIAQMTKRNEHLLSIRANCRNFNANIPSKLLDHFPQVHRHGFKDHAKMRTKFKGGEKTNAMTLVAWVCAS